jgi:hypothetical protein
MTEPTKLLELTRPVRAANLLIEGMAQEYLTAVMLGKQEAWARMAHSIIDLLASEPTPKVEHRGQPNTMYTAPPAEAAPEQPNTEAQRAAVDGPTGAQS